MTTIFGAFFFAERLIFCYMTCVLYIYMPIYVYFREGQTLNEYVFLGQDEFSWFDLIICWPTDSSHENQFVLPSPCFFFF